MHVGARSDVLCGYPDDLAVFAYRLALGNGACRNLVAEGNGIACRDVLARDLQPRGKRVSGDHDVVTGMKTDDTGVIRLGRILGHGFLLKLGLTGSF